MPDIGNTRNHELLIRPMLPSSLVHTGVVLAYASGTTADHCHHPVMPGVSGLKGEFAKIDNIFDDYFVSAIARSGLKMTGP